MPYSATKPTSKGTSRPTPSNAFQPRGAKFWPVLGFAALTGSRATSGPLFVSQVL